MNSERDPIRTGIIVSVVGGVILSVVIWLVGFLPTLWGGVKSAMLWVVGLLLFKIPIPVWLFIPLIVAVGTAVFLVASRFRKPREPTKRDYKKDEFSGVVWRWNFKSNGQIDDLACFCPQDDTQLVFTMHAPYESTFRCETCGTAYGSYLGMDVDITPQIKRQMQRKIRSGEWRKVVAIEAGVAVHPDD